LHPGEFGTYRENLAKKWLEMYIPERLELGNGFVITSKGKISSQCDIVVYDKTRTPKIENVDSQKFYPIETVAGVIEIKSDINSIGELNAHLIKLSQVKKFREDVEDPVPYYKTFGNVYDIEKNPYDNIFTILICNKLAFKLDLTKINYGDILPKYRHNLILSLHDGLINYVTPGGSSNLYISFVVDIAHKYDLVPIDNAELPNSIRQFLSCLHALVGLTTLLSIEMGFYLFSDTEISREGIK
jgi:hypothetical protein